MRTLSLIIFLYLSSYTLAKVPLNTPEAFMRDLYAAYERGNIDDEKANRISPYSTDAHQFFSPDLIKQVSDNVAVTPVDQVPFLNGNLLCDCQEADFGIVIHKIKAVQPSATQAQVWVTFDYFDRAHGQTLIFDLIALEQQWLIDDVRAPNTEGSFKADIGAATVVLKATMPIYVFFHLNP